MIALEVFGLAVLVGFGGRILESPAAPPNKASLIVILGGGSGDRLVKGGHLLMQGYAERVLITGLSEENMAVRPMHTNWREAYLAQLGVPRESIRKDSTAANSWQEALLIRGMMEENDWSNVLVVSDPPHLLRLSWIFNRIFEDSGLSYRLVSSEPHWWNAGLWWKNSASGTFVIEEFIKLLYYRFEYE